jgi:hypothetical protein
LVNTRDKKILDELVGLDGRLYEDRLYELVMQEVLSGDFDTVAMARAFEEAEGEEQKTKALYLKYRLRRLKDEGLVKTLIDEAQSSPAKLIENINSKIDKLTKDKQKSSLLSLLSLLCLSFFALTDFVVGDMYVIVIILLGIFFIGFSISASSTESKIQLLEKERKKMKNSAKISKPLLDWVRWIIVFAILSIVWSGLSGYDFIIQDRNPVGAFIGFSIPGLMIFTLPGLFIGGLITLMSKKNNIGLSVLILVNSVISVGLFCSLFI